MDSRYQDLARTTGTGRALCGRQVGPRFPAGRNRTKVSPACGPTSCRTPGRCWRPIGQTGPADDSIVLFAIRGPPLHIIFIGREILRRTALPFHDHFQLCTSVVLDFMPWPVNGLFSTPPRKIRDLLKALRKADFVPVEGGKGSHRKLVHKVHRNVTAIAFFVLF